MRYDLAVIGSGGAAFAAAIAARGKGRSVVMLEAATIGGTCVNTGCVPSKALLATAEARQVSSNVRFPGLTASPLAVDARQLINGKQQLVETLRAEKYTDLAEEYGWEILRGEASFAATEAGPVLKLRRQDNETVMVEAEHYLVATGSAPWAPDIQGLAAAGYLTSTTAMELRELPASMIVLGGSSVGLEQAQLWQRLGVRVQIVELLPRLAPFEEPELSAVIEDAFSATGITVLTGATVQRADRGGAGYRLQLTRADETSIELTAEQLLVAAGRRPVTSGLNLEEVGVRLGERGEVAVDAHLRTTNARIWAAGDVTGHPQFVYVAAAHGTMVADNALDDAARTLDYRNLPRVTFTSPAIASVGLTEAMASAAGIAAECRVLPLSYVPRALVNRDDRGVVKLVADQGTGRLLGAHVAAEGAGDIIAAAMYAMANDMTVHQIAEMWSPYLTMAEGLKLAAQTFTRDVSKLSCCAS